MFKKITSVLSTASVSVFTLLNGKKVGVDDFGNTYYAAKPRKGYKRERRWVMYNGAVEASKVPAEWHGWLHYQTDDIPSEDSPYRQQWQKEHVPNLTGTDYAYLPAGHTLRGSDRAEATGDYESWTPKG